MDKQAKFRFVAMSSVLLILLSLLIYAIGSSLESPIAGFVDDDGQLDLRGSCTPTANDGTTWFNVTNATISTNVDGTYKANQTIQVANPINDTGVVFFNFTVNKTVEGSFVWSQECNEANASDGTVINKISTTNRSIIVRYADAQVAVTPVTGTYSLNGNGIPITCAATPSNGWNITSIALKTNRDDVWLANETFTPIKSDGEVIANFTYNTLENASIADGTDLLFSCSVVQDKVMNTSDNFNHTITSEFSSPNRTVNIEYPPQIVLNAPANNSVFSTLQTEFNFTVTSAFTSSTTSFCQLWTNETGTTAVALSGISAANNTVTSIKFQIQDLSYIDWSIRCQEGGDANVFNFSVNRTVRVDRTSPVVSITAPTAGTFFNAKPFNITRSLTEVASDTCLLYINGTINATDVALVTTNFTIPDIDDGTYGAIVGCNDTAGNDVNSSSVTFTLDTVVPTWNSVGNQTVSDSADLRRFTLSASEAVNATVFYGTTVAVTSNANNAGFFTNMSFLIDDFVENTQYFWNITICDRAANCNTSGGTFGQFDFTFPWKLITGWSYYGINHAKINFSDILNQTDAEFVYYWNQTGQTWISATPGSSSNIGFEVGQAVGERANGGRQVVAIFEEINSTWPLRNVTNTSFYTYNITSGDNYIRLPEEYTFGTLARSLLNTSYSDGVSLVPGYEYGIGQSLTPGNLSEAPDGSTEAGGLLYNLTEFWFSAYNNTATTWTISYTYNFTGDNNTVLTVPGISEVLWVWSEYNLTWNGTNIIGNWTY